jgi:ubiquinone/menaquinone biosynthesis C-methylase UbiE
MDGSNDVRHGAQHVCPWWLIWTFDNPLRSLIHRPAEIVGPYVRGGMTAADIGCGIGYFSIPLAKMVGGKGSVFAVDVQREMLAMLKKRAEKAGVADRIRPVLSAGDDLSVTEPVDFVLAFWMVHEVKDIPRFLGQLFSLLKKGGSFLYAEPKMHVSLRRFREILGFAQQAGFQSVAEPHIRFSRAALLKKSV